MNDVEYGKALICKWCWSYKSVVDIIFERELQNQFPILNKKAVPFFIFIFISVESFRNAIEQNLDENGTTDYIFNRLIKVSVHWIQPGWHRNSKNACTRMVCTGSQCGGFYGWGSNSYCVIVSFVTEAWSRVTIICNVRICSDLSVHVCAPKSLR